jgi:hypothetical protein
MSTHSAGQIEKTGQLYNGIIESVIKNVREPFYDEGLDDQVIQELRELWICKLKESGVLSTNPAPIRMPQQITQQQNRTEEQNYPGHPAQRPRLDYVESQNTKGMQFAQRMQQMKQRAPNMQPQQQSLPQKQSQYAITQQNQSTQQYPNQSSSIQKNQYLNQPQNQLQQSQQNQPQNSYNTFHHVDGQMNLSESESEDDKKSSSSSSSDSEEEDKEDDKKSTSSESAKSSTGDVEEIALNSGDDIDEDDSVSFDNVKNTIYCQYEHVKRKQAAKWTIKLNNGVMNLDGKDYSFSKCHGEADW